MKILKECKERNRRLAYSDCICVFFQKNVSTWKCQPDFRSDTAKPLMRYGGFFVLRHAVAGLVFSAYMRMRVAVPGYRHSKRPSWLEGTLSDEGIYVFWAAKNGERRNGPERSEVAIDHLRQRGILVSRGLWLFDGFVWQVNMRNRARELRRATGDPKEN